MNCLNNLLIEKEVEIEAGIEARAKIKRNKSINIT